MEADTIVNMLAEAFRHLYFIIDVIVSNYDSTIQAVLDNPTICDRGQVLESSKEKLDE